MSDGLDFSKLDPLILDYIAEMREAAKKANVELKTMSLQRDALAAQLEEMKAAKLPSRTPDFRTLSPEDYKKALREMRHKAILAGYDERAALRNPELKDVKSMTPEEYKTWKMKVTGRRAW